MTNTRRGINERVSTDPDDPLKQIRKSIRLRYAGECRVRGVALPAKAEAIYERLSKTVRCTSPVEPSVDPSSIEGGH